MIGALTVENNDRSEPAPKGSADLHELASLLTCPDASAPLVDENLIKRYRADAKFALTGNPSVDTTIAAYETDATIRTNIASFYHNLLKKYESLPDQYRIAIGHKFVPTPYDPITGDLVNVFTDSRCKDRFLQTEIAALKYMQILTHPSVLEARLKMLANGPTSRIPKTVTVFEEALRNNEAVTWGDFGWPISEHRHDGPGDSSTSFIEANGIWSTLSKNPERPMVAHPIVSNSHPDLSSAKAVAEHALCGGVGFCPIDGPYLSDDGSGLLSQKIFVQETFNIIENHPLIALHKYGNTRLSNQDYVRAHLINEAKKRIGVTLKPYPVDESVERAKALYDLGVRVFRVFDPRDTPELVKTVREIRKACPQAIIFAGQVTGVESAKKCAEAGADVIIVNIGEGGSCITASGSGMAPNNIVTFYRIQKAEELKNLSIVVDGGTGPFWVCVPLLGGAGAMKHGSLIGGTTSQVPYFNAFWDSNANKFVQIQTGEAHERTKWRGGSGFDIAGKPRHKEGVGDVNYLFESVWGSSLPERVYRYFNAPMCKLLAFNRLLLISDLEAWEDPPIKRLSSNASHSAGPHNNRV